MRRILEQILRFDVGLIGLAVAAGAVSSRFMAAAPALALFLLVPRLLKAKERVRLDPAGVPIFVLMLMLPLSLWTTAFPAVTLVELLRLLGGVALYVAVVAWGVTRSRIIWLARGLAAGGLAGAILAFFSVKWFTNKLPFLTAGLYAHLPTAVGDSIHPNVMAGGLALLLPPVLGVVLFGRMGKKERIAGGVAAACMSVVIILTASRGAWLAVSAAMVLMGVLRWRRGWLAVVLAAAVAGAGLVWVGPGRVAEMVAASPTLGGLDGRIEVWQRAVWMIQDFPLTGVGMGAFGPVADALYPFFLFQPGSIPHAHNLYLQIAVDLGLPGLTAWLAIFIMMSGMAYQSYRAGIRMKDGWAAGLGAGLLCSQAVLGIHGCLDAVTWGAVRTAPLVWLLWACNTALWFNLRVSAETAGEAGTEKVNG